MRTFRRVHRAGSILIWTVGSLVVLILAWILTLGHQRARRRLQRAVFRRWSRALLRVCGARVTVVGRPPEDGVLLVTNHLSYVDIPLIAHLLPPRFIAKAEIRNWPLIGWCCRAVETIFIDRSSKRDTVRAGEEIRRGLARGDNVVLFPEGTSGPGHDLLPFKPSLLAPAAEAELPVHYAAITYRTPEHEKPAFLSVSWWGETDFFPHARELLDLDGFEAILHFGERPISGNDRKRLAADLSEAIGEIFTPTVDFEPESPQNPVPKTPPTSSP